MDTRRATGAQFRPTYSSPRAATAAEVERLRELLLTPAEARFPRTHAWMEARLQKRPPTPDGFEGAPPTGNPQALATLQMMRELAEPWMVKSIATRNGLTLSPEQRKTLAPAHATFQQTLLSFISRLTIASQLCSEAEGKELEPLLEADLLAEKVTARTRLFPELREAPRS